MTFPELPPLAQSLTAVWTLVVLLMFLYNLVRCLQLRRSPGLTALTGALFLLTFQLYQCLCYGLHIFAWQVPLVPAWFGFPMAHPPLVFGLLAGLTAIAAVQQYRLGKWLRSHLSAMSVKEAFDRLPTCLCYARENGLPLLVNREMARLSLSLTGEPLRDASRLWDQLQDGSLPGAVRSGESPVLELDDGRVYNIQRNEINIGGEALQELIAVDATELWQLTASLEEKEKRARLVNTRLKALLGTIEYVTMSRELLQLKTELHSRIGEDLLLTKRYLLSPGSIGREDLLGQWRQDLGSLIGGGSEPWQAPYYVTGREAALLGIELRVNGELPQEGPLLELAELAIQTHVTNVLRHAGGSLAEVESVRTEDGWRLTLTNDGEPPKEPVRETGGLASLRRRVEAAGGTLCIESAPRFRMTVELPEAEEPYGV